MFGGFILADISFWDIFASGGAFNSGSVVVCETFASPDMFASWGAFTSVSVVVWAMFASPENLALRSTINNILRIQNFPAVNTLIVALKGFKNTVSVYTGLAAWKINDFY